MVDLTLDTAQRAVDAYVLLKDKYKDAALENFDSLQDFVDRDPQGKAFEADVKSAGFSNVDDWNQTVTTVSAAYSNIIDDQSTDINLQIDDVQKDTEMAQDMKDRIIASLKALIPTENNRKIVQQLIDNPAYTEKLKQLETEEE
jgi:phosphoribosylformylglycinamidine (FGAM) synthase PurS component